MNWFAKAITKIRIVVRRVNRFLGIEIWRGEPEEYSWSKTKARIASDTRVVMRVLKTFQTEKIGFQSVALSYFCTLAAVPFIAWLSLLLAVSAWKTRCRKSYFRPTSARNWETR